MKIGALVARSVACALASFTPPASAQAPLFVSAFLSTNGQIGQGLLVQGRNACIVLTAHHVVEDDLDIDLAFSDHQAWRGRIGVHPKDTDVAIVVPVEPDSAPKQSCPSLPGSTEIAATALKTDAVLMVTSDSGATRPIKVRLQKSGADEIRIFSTDPLSPLVQGMSGAPMFVDNVMVGLFRKVDEDLPGKPGIVMATGWMVGVLGADKFPPPGANVSNPRISLTEANQALSLARESRPSGDLGQVAALQALVAGGKAVSGTDLAAISFDGAQLSGLVARDANFTLSGLAGAILDKADLLGSDLTFATLDKASFTGADLSGSSGTFHSAREARFDGAQLTKIGWRGANLARASFVGSDLQGAALAFSDLTGADFRGARFQDIVLIGADLRNARFDQASARSIDVTGALFEDATFPAGLRSALCTTQTVNDIDLIFREDLVASPKTVDQINDLAEDTGNAIRLRHRIDRFLPHCPSRAGLLGTYYDAMVDGPELTGDQGERVHGRINVSLPTTLLKNPARKQAALLTVKALVAAAIARDAVLDTSNAFYRDRPARLLADVKRSLAAARLTAPMWLTQTTLRILADKSGLQPATAIDLIASRFLPERAKELMSPERRNRDNWALLFPADMTNNDFTPEIQAAVLRWGKSLAPTLPSDVRIGLANVGDPTAQFQIVAHSRTLEALLQPWQSAVEQANFERHSARSTDCFIATNPTYKPEDYARAQKRMNYYGRDKAACISATDTKVDVSEVMGGDWFRGRTFIELHLRQGEIWILGLAQPLPPAMLDRGDVKAGVITGKIARVLAMPAGNGAPGTGYKVIVLDAVNAVPDR